MNEKLNPVLTPGLVASIINALRPGIQKYLEIHARSFLYVVVLPDDDPGHPLFNGPLGQDDRPYPKPYDAIARLKAELSARTGLDTSVAITQYPQLMQTGDVIYQGGVNMRGFSVGASGAQAPIDEAIARMIGYALIAHCQVLVQNQQNLAASGGPFVL